MRALGRGRGARANIAASELEAAARALQTATQGCWPRAATPRSIRRRSSSGQPHHPRRRWAGHRPWPASMSMRVRPSNPGRILMTIPPTLTDLIVEADVDEGPMPPGFTQGLPRAAANWRARITPASGPGRFRLAAASMAATACVLSPALGFDTPVRAPVGLTVTTNIIVDERAEAITVPRRRCIAETAEGATVFRRQQRHGRGSRRHGHRLARRAADRDRGPCPGRCADHGRYRPCRRAAGAGDGALMLYALKIATRYLTASKAQTALLVLGGGGGRVHLHLHVGADRGAGGISYCRAPWATSAMSPSRPRTATPTS